VTLEKDDFKRANVEATQTIDIVGFVDAADIPPYFYAAPYYTAPAKHGDKGYALLRETLERTGRVAVANVVIRTRQHLAVLYPRDNRLVLNTLRYADELRPAADIEVPETLKDAKVQPAEIKMAQRLLDDMTMKWDPDKFHDTYREDVMKMIEEKAAGHVRKSPRKRAAREAEVIDFSKLLARSLEERRRGAKAANDEQAGESPTRKVAPKRAAPKARRKAAAKRAAAHERRAA